MSLALEANAGRTLSKSTKGNTVGTGVLRLLGGSPILRSIGNKPSAKPRPKRKAQTSRLRKPDDMSLEQWQIALRREFGQAQKFRLKNVGNDEVFSEFEVTNPQTGRTYRITIRGASPGDNHCTCPDFAVNTLGTCKHIEFTLARLHRRPGGKTAFKAGFLPPYSEICLRYGARRQVMFRPGAECPPALRQLVGRYFEDGGILRDDSFDTFDLFLRETGKNGHEIRFHDDALAFVAQMRDRAALVKRVEEAFPDGIHSPAFDKLLKVPLYEYQRQGALFAARAGRSLVADDMGLGKTIQAIAAIEILARVAGVERVLVITPTSLKHQWEQEINRFTDRSCQVIQGLTAARHAAYGASSFYKIANYEVIHRDLAAIGHWAPDLIVLDEAQRIKNWKTRSARTVKQLPSQYAIVLTGTPLENRLEELHSIVEFVDRFRLGPSFRFLHEHQAVDDTGRVVGYRNLRSISQTLSPILLRRTKAEVLKELPQRLEKHLFVPMTPQQRVHHDENAEIVARIVAKWRRCRFLSEADQRRLTVALQNMRMSCNSTYLLDQSTDYGNKVNEFMAQLSELLEHPDTKAVVFSQWLRTHELLSARLDSRGQDYVLFHGGVPGPKRKDLVQRFKEDERCRVFLATDAGGVGLNLQHASAVLNMDQPWNPAVIEQRIGRVHRLGQRHTVNVVHFVAENTIEHAMLNTLKFKRSVFAGVLDGGENDVFLGGTRLTKFMESVEKATGTIPAPPDAVLSAPPPPLPPVPQPAAEERPALPAPALGGGVGGAPQPPESAGGPLSAPSLAPLADLISLGRQLLDGLGAVLAGSGGITSASDMVERDEKSGRSYLRLPMPKPEALDMLAAVVAMLKGGGRRSE
jgi:superfamily II DNA or RNA helicase